MRKCRLHLHSVQVCSWSGPELRDRAGTCPEIEDVLEEKEGKIERQSTALQKAAQAAVTTVYIPSHGVGGVPGIICILDMHF